jgi:hypothetical protein
MFIRLLIILKHLLILGVYLTLIGNTIAKTEEIRVKMRIDELFTEYVTSLNIKNRDSIEQKMNDSIHKYVNHILRSVEILDTIKQSIELKFEFDYSLMESDFSILTRNVYHFELTRNDSIFAQKKFTEEIDTLDKSIKEFIINPENNIYLPQKNIVYIEYFDTVEITKHGFYIDCYVFPDSTGERTSWKTISNTVNLIVNNYLELRNEQALKTWNKKYESLEFKQKVSLTNYYPMNIIISLNERELKEIIPTNLQDIEHIKFFLDIEDEDVELEEIKRRAKFE